MSEDKNLRPMTTDEAENVAGGNDGHENYGTGGWVYGTVHGVVHYDDSACLTFRDAPDGNVQYDSSGKPYGWQNGQSIRVQPSSRQGSWIKANMGDMIGWVNAQYVTY